MSQTSNASRAYEVKLFSTLPTLEEAFALKNVAQCRLAELNRIIQLDPHHRRAVQRRAKLRLRLGLPDGSGM
jgi:hypothetical protein